MAGQIPKVFIDQLISRVDIVEIIDRLLPLTQKGSEYVACCPFHDEKTASFTVSPSKQFYHCFGCGAHGTAIGFLMDYANLDFIEAVEDLAKNAGLVIPRNSSSAASTESRDNSGPLLEVVTKAKAWFQKQLNEQHPDGQQAMAYLQSRGLDAQTITAFGIGFAPDSWSSLTDTMGKTVAEKNLLIEAGLIKNKTIINAPNQQKNRFYDVFRNRVIFPIEDHRGRVIGFGGRVLDDSTPKYLNSPQTALFHKGKELYGLHRARRPIAKHRRSIVVEGYMDVVSLVQYGVDNAVATLGTATTQSHLQRLFRLAPEIVFCFDGDNAGREAAWKALQIALPELHDGRQASFLFLGDGEDPDTAVRSEGGGGFIKRLESVIPLPDFLFKHLIDEVDMSRMDGKARLVSLARPLISQIPGEVLKSMMYARLSSLGGITIQPDRSTPPVAPPAGKQSSQLPADGQISLVCQAISLLLQNPSLAKCVDNYGDLAESAIPGSDSLSRILDMCVSEPEQTTARILETFRETSMHDHSMYDYMACLAIRPSHVDAEILEKQFRDIISKLLKQFSDQRPQVLIDKSKYQPLTSHEKAELKKLLNKKLASQP